MDEQVLDSMDIERERGITIKAQSVTLDYEARNGETVVALVAGNEATLKRYYREGPRVRLVPANSGMDPIEVPAAEVMIQGVVRGLMRTF